MDDNFESQFAAWIGGVAADPMETARLREDAAGMGLRPRARIPRLAAAVATGVLAVAVSGIVLVWLNTAGLRSPVGQTSGSQTDQFTTSIAGGLDLEMTADEVARLVTAHLEATKQQNAPLFDGVEVDIVSVDAMTFADALASRGEGEAGGESTGMDRPVWLVTANGPFLTQRGRGSDPIIGISGHYIIEDSTAQTLGYGINS
jgi:hypothetical protein